MSASRKEVFEHLAIGGAPPAFSSPLHVGRPNLGDRATFDQLIGEMFERRWLTNNGPIVQEFERQIAVLTQTRHAISFCNATVALEVLVRGCGLTGEVIVPGFTFVATAHCLDWLGVRPVFCDVSGRDHTIDVARVENLITPQTTAILATHVWGKPCDVRALEAICKRRGLKLLFDAAHAFGCRSGDKPIGGFGDAEVFSFHGTKFINAFEGGAITTNDDELAQRLRLMRNFGFAGLDLVVSTGTNGKMTEVCAAMGLSSLKVMEQIIDANRRNHAEYSRLLQGISGLSVFQYEPAEAPNYQYVIVDVDAAVTGLSRDDLVSVLGSENVLARKYFAPGCHKMAPYAARGGHAPLPVTESLASSLLALPTGTAVTLEDIRTVVSILKVALASRNRVAAVLSARSTAA